MTAQLEGASKARWALAGADVTGDRVDEIVVGGDQNAFVYSGADGALLGRVPAVLATWTRDHNEDGRSDLLVAAPTGGARHYCGRRLTPLDNVRLDLPVDAQLTALVSVPDQDGDGFSELLFGAADSRGPGATTAVGAAWLVSGKSGKLVRRFSGTTEADAMGTAVCVGPPRSDGSVQIVLGGRSKFESWTIAGGEVAYVGGVELHTFGTGSETAAIQSVGDVDGDGWLDVVVAGMQGVEREFYSGCLRVVSSVDGRILFDLRTRAGLRTCGRNVMTDPWRPITGVDVDRDGHSDLAIGVESIGFWPGRPPLEIERGRVVFVSGADGSVMRTTRFDQISEVVWDDDGEYWSDCYAEPWGVSNLGDVNRDGFEDLLVVPRRQLMYQAYILNGQNGRRIGDVQLLE